MSYVVMDLELKELVSEETGGWDAARRGERGISVIGVYDSTEDWYYLYDQHVFDDCAAHLEAADTVVTFNGLEFDVPCMQGVLGRTMLLRGHYDILQEVWKVTGQKHRGYGLGPISLRTLGIDKKGSGESAPALWQAGRLAELHNYCLYDVHLTRKLFEHIMDTGYIIGTSGDPLYLNPHITLGDLEMTSGRPD